MPKLKKQLQLLSHSEKLLTALIDQQMWCWGCDVKHSDGNLLMKYGAEKRQSPNPRYHSAYHFYLENNSVLNLWGWGMWIASPQHGSLFLGRSRSQIRYIPEIILTPDAWCKADLPLTDTPLNPIELTNAQQLFARALGWISEYEIWINTQTSPDYREQAVMDWPQRNRYQGGIPVLAMSSHWSELSSCELH